MKGLMPATTTATELQRNYKKVKNRAKRIKEPITVLSNNKPELIIIDYEVFKNIQEIGQQKADKKDPYDEVFGSWTKEEAEEFNNRTDKLFENIDEEMWK